MACDPELLARLERLAPKLGEPVQKKMFGGVAFMYRDYMAFGPINDTLMVRVGPEFYPKALEYDLVGEMEFTGRPMKGYVTVQPDAMLDDEQLFFWLTKAVEFVHSLPAKKPKAVKKPKPPKVAK